MLNPNRVYRTLIFLSLFGVSAFAQKMSNLPRTTGRPGSQESAAEREGPPPVAPEFEPSLPEGMTLEDVFKYSETPPPEGYPHVIKDDRMRIFTLVEKLEYRFGAGDETDHLGWESQGWMGADFNKFWWKHEGEAVLEGGDEFETETDLLYSRLITPFWNFQVGAQYANGWNSDDYEDFWSGVIALQGMAPYKFELDNALYLSEDGDVLYDVEAEYDIRITQRLGLQPLAEAGLAFQDIPERGIGAGITDVNLDLRLRYEIKREFAPYIGVRSRFLIGETGNMAEDEGIDTEQLYFITGVRFAF